MSNNELFLREFRRVENTLRNKFGITYLTFEEKVADETLRPKMQVCRILRNYLTHEYDGDVFISVSQAQIQFLQGLCCVIAQLRR